MSPKQKKKRKTIKIKKKKSQRKNQIAKGGLKGVPPETAPKIAKKCSNIVTKLKRKSDFEQKEKEKKKRKKK